MTADTGTSSGFQLSEVRKTIITAVGMIVAVGTFILDSATGFLPDGWAGAISAGIGVLTILLNYLAPNETTNVERALGRSVRVKGTKPLSPYGRHALPDPVE